MFAPKFKSAEHQVAFFAIENYLPSILSVTVAAVVAAVAVATDVSEAEFAADVDEVT